MTLPVDSSPTCTQAVFAVHASGSGKKLHAASIAHAASPGLRELVPKGEKMESSQLSAYLGRIGVSAQEGPTLDTLKQIQEKHVYAIPVENLDIIKGKLPLSLDVNDLVDKVVNRRRGGISFELNVLLADALRDLGYDVKLMSAKHPRYGHEFDHAFLMVDVPGDEGTWLVDVGFTEGFRTPLLFDDRIWQSDGREEYSFARSADDAETWQLLKRRAGEVELVYSFKLKEHLPEEYEEQCKWFCTNSASRFTQGPFVFIERPEGRICLSMDTVKITYTGEQIRPVITTDEEERAVLREIFGIETDEALLGGANQEDKFGYGRVFAALGGDSLRGAVIEEAVRIALEQKAHVRFGHIAVESAKSQEFDSFPAYVKHVREILVDEVANKIDQMGVADQIIGGEVVVMGSNTQIGATIDTPANYAPDQLVESLIKPFNPDVVVCGDSGKSRLMTFIQGSASDYLSHKLDCKIVKVKETK